MLLPRAVPLPPLHILWPRPVGVFEPPVEEPGDPRADGAPPDGVGRGRRRAQQGDDVVFRAWLVWGRAPHVDEGAESSNPLVGCFGSACSMFRNTVGQGGRRWGPSHTALWMDLPARRLSHAMRSRTFALQ